MAFQEPLTINFPFLMAPRAIINGGTTLVVSLLPRWSVSPGPSHSWTIWPITLIIIRYVGWPYSLGQVGVVGQGWGQMLEIVSQVWHHCYLALRSRSKVGVKVKVQGQGHISRVQQLIPGADRAWSCWVHQRAITPNLGQRRVITSLRCLSVCLLSVGMCG